MGVIHLTCGGHGVLATCCCLEASRLIKKECLQKGTAAKQVGFWTWKQGMWLARVPVQRVIINWRQMGRRTVWGAWTQERQTCHNTCLSNSVWAKDQLTHFHSRLQTHTGLLLLFHSATNTHKHRHTLLTSQTLTCLRGLHVCKIFHVLFHNMPVLACFTQNLA